MLTQGCDCTREFMCRGTCTMWGSSNKAAEEVFSPVRVGCPAVDTVQGERTLRINFGGRPKECPVEACGRVAFLQ